MKHASSHLLFVVFLCLFWRAHAACVYNREANAIWLYDYTEELPAAPRQILFADQVNDWGLVHYERSNDVYSINANLWVGRDNNTETFFQLGSPEHPNTTLIMNGNLVIYPASPQKINRMTLGCSGNTGIYAKLLFNNTPDATHTIHAGAYYRGRTMSAGVVNSGELHVYNGLLSSADPKYPIGRHLYLYLNKIIIENTVISRVTGTIGYGLNAKNSSIKNCIFEDSNNAFCWGPQVMRGVTFRRLKVAVSDSDRYPIAAILTECRFEDNEVNWSLCAGNLYLVDCDIKPPVKRNLYAARTNAVFKVRNSHIGGVSETKSAAEMRECIRAVSSRHVVIKVIDTYGRPVNNVIVMARCEQDDRIIRKALTGADGQTPGRNESGALLLDEWEESAGEIENQPAIRKYSYAVCITPRGGDQAQVLEDYFPTQSWQKVTVEVKK